MKKEEGGSQTPFLTGHRPQFHIRTWDMAGTVEGSWPGLEHKNVEWEISLSVPVVLEEGTQFAIREGGKTLGSGVVTKILE